MTKPKRYKRYSAEFKREAILRAAERAKASSHQGSPVPFRFDRELQ